MAALLFLLLAQQVLPAYPAAAAQVETAELGADAAAERLLPWLRAEGVDVGPVAVRNRGLIATAAIAPGDIYLAIPYRLAIGPEHALRDPVIAPLLAQLDAAAKHTQAQTPNAGATVAASAKLRDCTLTVLHLLSERAKGAR